MEAWVQPLEVSNKIGFIYCSQWPTIPSGNESHLDRNVVAPYYYRAQGKTYIDNALMSDTTGFVVCYLIIYVIGTLLLTLTANASLTEAMFEFASALGTVGLSIGLTGPGTNAATLIVEIVGMVLGRLEIFIVLMGIYSSVSLLKKACKVPA